MGHLSQHGYWYISQHVICHDCRSIPNMYENVLQKLFKPSVYVIDDYINFWV